MRLVECVPNFSEGRDRAVLEAIAEAIRGVAGTSLLDMDPGAAAHRTVFTFVGEPEAALEAGFRAIRTAAEKIDLRNHHGEHPRMGATDVFPFVPVTGVSMDECVALARTLGRRVAEELHIPVYLYEYAATSPERRALSSIRAGEYEGLPAKLRDPAWKPDFGEPVMNERSGATVIGARKFLVAYNVNLNTREKKFAGRIAKAIREQGRPVRAIGWYIAEYQAAQVSMNLIDLDEVGIHHAFDECVRQADLQGLRVTGSEIVGLVPEDALAAAGRHYLARQGKSPGADRDELDQVAVRTLGLSDVAPFRIEERIIERRLARRDGLAALPVERFLARLSSPSPTPGGGSVAALAAACSAALTAMVANLTYERKGYEGAREEMGSLALRAQEWTRRATAAVEADAAAYDGVLAASRLKAATPEDAAAKRAALGAAGRRAAEVPLGLLEQLAGTVEAIDAVARRGNPNCLSDAAAAAAQATAAAEIAYANVLANLPSVDDRRWAARTRQRAAAWRERTVKAANGVAARGRRVLEAAAAPVRPKRKVRRG